MIVLFGQWEFYPGNQPYSLALPDYFSTYLSYTINVTDNPNIGLRIKGAFPNARYMSFNIYNTTEGNSLGALTDFQITPSDSNDNPFVAGSTASPGGEYVINVQQETDQPPDLENLITFNPDDLSNPDDPSSPKELTLILRYYVPQPADYGGAERTTIAGVEAPTIEAYKLGDASGDTFAAPDGVATDMDKKVGTFTKRLLPAFQTVDGDTLHFYHAEGGGQFPNADNIYLICAVKNVDGVSNGVMLKVKPPTFPLTNQVFDQTIVRYWSFNQGNPDTSTPWGMKDEQLKVASDGFMYLLMGCDSFSAAAKQLGWNFMPWKADTKKAIILYRNMLTIPQYRGSIARVPTVNPPLPPDLAAYEAYQTIGDYAPVGKVVTEAQLNEIVAGLITDEINDEINDVFKDMTHLP
jgi:hypothetical protein